MSSKRQQCRTTGNALSASASAKQLRAQGAAAVSQHQEQQKRRCGKCDGCMLQKDCGKCDKCQKRRLSHKSKAIKEAMHPCLQRRCYKIHGPPPCDPHPDDNVAPSLAATATCNTEQSTSEALHYAAAAAAAAAAGVSPENYENWKVLSKFSPTAYLTFQPANKPTLADNQQPLATTMYGLPIPNPPVENVCALCYMRTDMDFDDGNPILLCDGCDREFHLRCLQPRYSFVPDHDFYCWNCSPTGTTASLQDYLQQIDKGRAKYATRAQYITALREKLIGVYNKSLGGRKRSKFSIQDYRIPAPELDMDHIQKIQSAINCSETGATGGNSSSENGRAAAVVDENTEEFALGPDFLVGKPVELFFNDTKEGERLHTGRIVDCRPTSDEDGVMEYLVRFPAGADYRKTHYAAWIVLEEHVITVGSQVVWIEEKKTQWIPAIVQLRTVLSLIMLQQSQTIPEPESPPRHSYRAVNSKRERISAWTRTFGDRPGLIVRDMRSQAMPFAPTEKGQLSQLAAVEWHEQQRVCDWWKMKQVNPYGYRALSSRDEYELEALVPVNQASKRQVNTHADLCPLVPRGLDRIHIANLMRRGGSIEPTTKDVASTLCCKIVSMSSPFYSPC